MIKFLKKRKQPKKSDDGETEIDNYGDNVDDPIRKIEVNRSVYNYSKFTRQFPSSAYVGFSVINLLMELYVRHFKPSKQCATKQLKNRLPVITMLSTYKIRDYLFPDVIAGITVGITHIPQGLGFALLVGVPPVYGLYTSFYPVIFYILFGTSRHLSMGTVAVLSLMIGNMLRKLEPTYVPPVGYNSTESNESNQFLSDDRVTAQIMIVMANAFWVGIIQILMFFLQLGFVTSYLSEPLVNGFLTGSAVHVLTSQLSLLFGITLTGYSGILKIPKTWIDLFSKLGQTQVPTLITSIICITILLVVKIHINERFHKKLPIPVPIELVIVIFGTLISYLTRLRANYHINVIGFIPAGIPGPSVPPIELFGDMVVDSFLIAIIAFATNFSLADMLSKKHRYKINVNQELLAYGMSNLGSSFFPCFAGGASLPRTCIQDEAGGKTQVVSILSCIVVALVLATIAPLFEDLPKACLASIIAVSLKNLFLQLRQLAFYWKVNKIEFFQFLIIVLATTFLDIDIGLGVGVAYYILAHIARSSQPYSTLLGNIYDTELYKDIKLYKDAEEFDGIKIVRIQQELHATNAAVFKKTVYELTKVKPQFYLALKNKQEARKKRQEDANKPSALSKFFSKFTRSNDKPNGELDHKANVYYVNTVNLEDERQETNGQIDELTEYELNNRLSEGTEYDIMSSEVNEDNRDNAEGENQEFDFEDALEADDDKDIQIPKIPIKYIIIDCSPINFIDSVGVKAIKHLISDYNEIGVKVFLAECNDAFRHRFKSMELASKSQYLDEKIMFVSIHDAVLSVHKPLKNNKNDLTSRRC